MASANQRGRSYRSTLVASGASCSALLHATFRNVIFSSAWNKNGRAHSDIINKFLRVVQFFSFLQKQELLNTLVVMQMKIYLIIILISKSKALQSIIRFFNGGRHFVLHAAQHSHQLPEVVQIIISTQRTVVHAAELNSRRRNAFVSCAVNRCMQRWV